MSNPLSPLVYFARNPSRVLPMGFVIVLSVFLIAAIASIAGGIDLTVRTIYRYTEFFTYVIPQRQSLTVPDDQRQIVKADPRTERVIEGSIFFVNIKSVIGRLPFVVLGVSADDRAYLLKRMETSLISGRMPAEGMPECIVSEPLAENRHVGVGDVIAGPMDEGGISGSPIEVRVVGIVRGPVWVALSTKSFCDATFLATPRCLLFTAKDQPTLYALNHDMMSARHKASGKLAPRKVSLISRENLLEEVRDSLATMYLLMNIVTSTVIFVIALMSGMLANIYFTQRLSEFGVLHAIGYSRLRLIARIIAETALLTTVGWVVGALCGYALLVWLKDSVFRSRGLFIDPMDPWNYSQTLPVPIAITIFAVATIAVRLMRLDAVTIIERR